MRRVVFGSIYGIAFPHRPSLPHPQAAGFAILLLLYCLVTDCSTGGIAEIAYNAPFKKICPFVTLSFNVLLFLKLLVGFYIFPKNSYRKMILWGLM